MNRRMKGTLEEPHTRRLPNKLTLHSLSPLQSKFVSGIPDGKVLFLPKLMTNWLPPFWPLSAVAHEEQELARLAKIMKNNDLLGDPKQDSILKKIIPKYRPNSKAKCSPLAAAKEQSIRPHCAPIRPLRTSQSDADHHTSSPPVARNVRGGSCAKISSTSSPQSHSVSSKTSKLNPKTGKKTCKVRFSKKVTVHYVPSDEERG